MSRLSMRIERLVAEHGWAGLWKALRASGIRKMWRSLTKRGEIGVWRWEHLGPDGAVLDWGLSLNDLADEGEEAILASYFRGDAVGEPSGDFFLRLCDEAIVDTDGLSDISSEPSGNGYAGQAIEQSAVGWPTLALDAGDFKATSNTVTFTASGGSFSAVSRMYLATTSDNAGRLIAHASLGAQRIVDDGQSLQCTLSIKLS